MSEYYYEDENLPSLTASPEMVRALKNSKITTISRVYSQRRIEMEKKENPNILNKNLFNTLSTPIRLHLDNGDIIALTMDPVSHSVVAWFDLKSGVEVLPVITIKIFQTIYIMMITSMAIKIGGLIFLIKK